MSERLQKSIISSSSNKQTPTRVTQTGVVVDIILDETHPRLKQKNDKQTFYTEKDLFYIGGVVIRPFSDKTSPNERLSVYRPLNQHEIDLPVIGETVELVEVAGVTYYKRIFGNSLNKGKAAEKRADLIYPDKEKTNSVENYGAAVFTGTPLGNTSSSETNDTTKFGKYFTHNPINRLKLYEGDKIIQSRFGQSIRFSAYNNTGNTFSPTIILRNRQNPETLSSLKEGDLTEEEVNKDGSVIVLSSGDYQIPFVATTSISPSKFSTYPNPLKGDDHLLINSGKIIISSKTGEMVFHSKADYGFISDGKFSIDGGLGADLDFGDDVNITTDRNGSNFLVKTGDGKIFLNTNTNGKSPNTDKSSEPLVRGNTLKELLETLIDLIKEQVYRTPSGPTAIGPENKPDFDQLKSRLSEMLSTQNFTE
jgi:hypothetical protein